MKKKRLFFGFKVDAPWPDALPEGRYLHEEDRHITVAFLGDIDFTLLKENLHSCPKPGFHTGLVGMFDRCVFLPKRKANVAAWHIKWFDEVDLVNTYQKEIVHWLQKVGFSLKTYDNFLPHTTICRRPFKEKEWEDAFEPLPMMITDLQLYESLGNSKYEAIWKKDMKPPFEEFEHTADIAFRIWGEDIKQLHLHARHALAFKFPSLVAIFSPVKEKESVEDIVIDLNEIVSEADQRWGCPFKAVSFHGDIRRKEELLCWEMIVDV